jgi:hypothetical protein
MSDITPLVPRDERIPVITGLPLVDADPKGIARRLRRLPWDKRARFFSAIVAESLENYAKMADLLESEEERDVFTEFALVGMMRATGQVLHGLETVDAIESMAVADLDLAAVFALVALSLDPAHRRAARRWIGHTRERTTARFFAEVVAARWQPLAVLFDLIQGTLPGAGQAWSWRVEP